MHTAVTPDGEPVTLWRDGDGFVVRVRRDVLMTSRQHGSEAAMMEAALESVPAPRRVLVGGLGMGFTLRAALDRLPGDARVVVVELLAEIVEWNRGVLGHLAGHPLDDPRVRVVVDDLNACLARDNAAFDVILLDIDNGPQALTLRGNERLYDRAGATLLRDRLTPGGALAVWSAGPAPVFTGLLGQAGLEVTARKVPLPGAGRGSAHHLLLARRP